MSSAPHHRPHLLPRRPACCLVAITLLSAVSWLLGDGVLADAGPKVSLGLVATSASTGAAFERYTQKIPETELTFDMVPIPGGKFLMGSPESEEGRVEDEGPQVEVEIKPFWMATHEVTWDAFDVFAFAYDIKQAELAAKKGTPLKRTAGDKAADAVTRPTPPYVDMTFGYGHDGYPAICMTQHAAIHYCKWLSAKTGHKYRLPTEAEWEYACRAGTKTPYFFGDDSEKLGEYAWFFDNSNEQPQPVGKKKPSPWGLYDILGNVNEWCADKYVEDYYTRISSGEKPPIKNPCIETEETPWGVARGGSWEDDPEFVRCAARRGANEEWSVQDPQEPKSIWWHTDAQFVGIRLVRSFEP